MRAPSLFLTAVGAAALLGACNDRSTPTERRSAAAFDVAGRDSTGGPAGPSHYSANGATASVSWYVYSGFGGDSGGGGGYASGSLYASRVGQITDEWTLVNWYIVSCYATCQSSSGYGYVPGSALTGSGGGDLRLSFSPSDYPGSLWVYGDSIGPIDVTWRKNGWYSSRVTGTTRQTYPWYTYESNGVSESASATATGAVGGFTLPAWSYADMGTNHSVTISFYR